MNRVLRGSKLVIAVKLTGLLLFFLILDIFSIAWANSLLREVTGIWYEPSFITFGQATALVIVVILSTIISVVWVFLFVPLIAGYLLSPVLYISEFIIRRIAEYPKGPLLALSAFLGAVASLLKVFA